MPESKHSSPFEDAGHPRKYAVQPGQPVARAEHPLRGCSGGATNLPADRATGHAFGRQKHNLRPLAQPVFRFGPARQALKLGTFRLRPYDRSASWISADASLNYDSHFRNSGALVMRRQIIFVSTMTTSAWGGSEELWSRAARELLDDGHRVVANIHGSRTQRARIDELAKNGAIVNERMFTRIPLRPKQLHSVLQPVFRNACRRLFSLWLRRQQTDLICISNGGISDSLGLMQLCMRSGKPYTIIVHANAEQWWPDDKHARILIDVYTRARRVFFVATHNRSLLETQLGIALPNAELVRNPFNVSISARPSWPSSHTPIRLACIGRMDPDAKGQDLLLQVLAMQEWGSRPAIVSFFGCGDAEKGLQRLSDRLGLTNRVRFCGHVANVESIWAVHHALVLPSRYEGLPLAAVEAMMCGRPVIVTNVGGYADVVQDNVTGFVAEAPTCRHLHAAMERAWAARHRWQQIGTTAASAIRELIPENPGRAFANRLLELAGTSSGAVLNNYQLSRAVLK